MEAKQMAELIQVRYVYHKYLDTPECSMYEYQVQSQNDGKWYSMYTYRHIDNITDFCDKYNLPYPYTGFNCTH